MSYQGITPPIPHLPWYAVRIRSRYEKTAASVLEAREISHYLPVRSVMRQWSDRKQKVDFPLFPGYLFVQLHLHSQHKLKVLSTPGVVGFVENRLGPLPIPGHEIESVRKVIETNAECSPHAVLKQGDPVRIVRGPLAGVEGTLLRLGSKSRLVVTIELIQRAISVEMPENYVELLATAPNHVIDPAWSRDRPLGSFSATPQN